MKKIIYSSILLFISVFSFGQSTLISPSRVENNSFVNNNFKVESSHSFLGFSAIRFNPTFSTVKNPVLSGNTILTLGGGGYYNTTDDIHFSKARISFIATENYSATASGSKISFLTTPNGSLATSERMSIDHNGNVGIGATATDKLHVSNGGSGEVYLKVAAETSGLSGLRLQNNGGDWQLFTNEFDRMFLDYSPDNFATRTGVLVFKPNGTDFDVQPTTNNKVFLGSSSLRWKEIWSVNALNTSSDRRLKKNIVEIKYGLEDVLKLNAVSYNWKNNTDSKLHLGFIAQEVDKIIPEIVSKSNLSDEEFEKLQKKGELPSDTYGMEYTGLIPVLVKAIQEQQQIINEKGLEISELKGKLQKMGDLEARLSSIEASLNTSKAKQEVKAEK